MWRTLLMGFFFYTGPAWFTLHGFVDYYTDYMWSLWDNEPSHVYDFIIVGAGSAGATIAHRLSKNHRILLIEAGGHPHFLSQVPGFALDLTRQPQWDWMYTTVPQSKAGLGLQNNISYWPRGKVLGGSSTLNYMLYLRGHPLDYDNWAKITGDEEWNYEHVLPYFKKSIKNYNGKYKTNKKHYEGSPYGFLNIESTSWTNFSKEFVEAGKELGFNEIDANGPQTEGFGPLEVTQLNGRRYGTYGAILKDLMKKPNVDVLTYSQATKIKLDKHGQAIGVHYVRHGRHTYAMASKEIIISAGSVDSPKLLMLSGIGPKVHLNSVGIKPKIDLPVGKNLEDHVTTVVMPFTIEKAGIVSSPDKDFSFGFLSDFFSHGKGPLTCSGALVAQGFLCSETLLNRKSKCEWPDLQVYFAPISVFQMMGPMMTRAVNLRPDYVEKNIPPLDKDGFYFIVALVRPNSKGDIKLGSRDPFSSPVIDPKYLTHPKDTEILLQGIKFMLTMGENTTTFQNIGTEFAGIPQRDCESFEFRSDDYWRCYIAYNSITIWHPTGTCKMGRGPSDKTAVVDSKLRVLGTKGLRVADASIMPVIVNANTNAPAIMIGEKAASFIQEHWADQYLVSNYIEHSLLYADSYKCYYSKLT